METLATANASLLLGAALVIVGILSSLIATRFGAPILAVFLGVGMLAGEDGPGGIHFADYGLTNVVGAFALTIILFDGGLRTRFASLRGVLAPSLVFATLGTLVTAVLGGLLSYYLFDLGARESFLLGAIIASTDAAAVFFLVRTGGLQLKHRVGATLEIESGTNDPVAVFLTLATVELILSGELMPGWDVLGSLVQQAGIGALVGVIGGYGLVAVLNRVVLPTGLHPLLAIAGAIFIYAVAAVVDGSGFLAAYIAGLIVGNRPVRAYASILSLHDAATWLVQIVMFLMLGLLVTPHRLLAVAVPAIAVSLFLIFVARPVAVWLSLGLFRYSLREKLFVSWVGLRGAVSIFLAVVPTLAHLPHRELYFNVAFFVVLVSILVQGWSTKWVALKLQQALPRVSAPVSRIDIDLPGQLDTEMVGYPIGADSRVLSVSTLPSWALPMLVARKGEILSAEAAQHLRAGDYAYFLAPTQRVNRLDRLFASTSEWHPLDALDSEFPIRGDAPLDKLDQLYGMNIASEERRFTVAELFAARFETAPQVGDSLPLGQCLLIVRAMDGEDVSRAGLQFSESEAGAQAKSLRGWFRAGLNRMLRFSKPAA